MKKKILVFAGILLATGSFFTIYSKLADSKAFPPIGNSKTVSELQLSEKELNKFVLKFCALVEQNDEKSLEKYLTPTPEEYWKVYENAGKEQMGNSFVEKKENTRSLPTFTTEYKKVFTSKEELMEHFVKATDLITSQKRSLSKIIKIKHFGSEAKATVAFGNDKLEDIIYEILLYNDGNGWKVFYFNYPDPYSAKYAEIR